MTKQLNEQYYFIYNDFGVINLYRICQNNYQILLNTSYLHVY